MSFAFVQTYRPLPRMSLSACGRLALVAVVTKGDLSILCSHHKEMQGNLGRAPGLSSTASDNLPGLQMQGLRSSSSATKSLARILTGWSQKRLPINLPRRVTGWKIQGCQHNSMKDCIAIVPVAKDPLPQKAKYDDSPGTRRVSRQCVLGFWLT